METFVINPGQGTNLEVVGEAGLSLSVGSWLSEWLCREVGGEIERTGETQNNFKLVLAEPLGLEGHVNRRVTTVVCTVYQLEILSVTGFGDFIYRDRFIFFFL